MGSKAVELSGKLLVISDLTIIKSFWPPVQIGVFYQRISLEPNILGVRYERIKDDNSVI